MGNNVEEYALTLKRTKKNLTKNILIDYLGTERLSLNSVVINNTLNELRNAISSWYDLINISFLDQNLKDDFKGLLEKRIDILKL